MKQSLHLLKKLLYPKTIVVIVLALLSASALVFVFANGLTHSVPAYIAYALSAYSLTITVARMVIFCKTGYAKLHSNEFYHRYATDLIFKARVSICISLVVNGFYCVAKGAAAIYYRSTWLGAMAFYYMVLAVTRFTLLRHVRKDENDILQAWKRNRFCGCLLLVLTIALNALNFHVVYANQVIVYPGFLIYAAAAFTFYQFTMAILNLVRYRKLKNPVFSADKMLAMATASVSLFFLQVAMFSVFGSDGTLQRYMNLFTCGCVFLFVIGMAVFMIRRAAKRIAAHDAGQN